MWSSRRQRRSLKSSCAITISAKFWGVQTWRGSARQRGFWLPSADELPRQRRSVRILASLAQVPLHPADFASDGVNVRGIRCTASRRHRGIRCAVDKARRRHRGIRCAVDTVRRRRIRGIRCAAVLSQDEAIVDVRKVLWRFVWVVSC